jgi:hypothetical protein
MWLLGIVLVGPTLFSPYSHATRMRHHFSQRENTAPARDLSVAAPRRSLPVSLATRAARPSHSQHLPLAPPALSRARSPSVASPSASSTKATARSPTPMDWDGFNLWGSQASASGPSHAPATHAGLNLNSQVPAAEKYPDLGCTKPSSIAFHLRICMFKWDISFVWTK